MENKQINYLATEKGKLANRKATAKYEASDVGRENKLRRNREYYARKKLEDPTVWTKKAQDYSKKVAQDQRGSSKEIADIPEDTA